MSRIAPVVRRVGGLEDHGASSQPLPFVVRRVGGLEVAGVRASGDGAVVRRVGGLEGCLPC